MPGPPTGEQDVNATQAGVAPPSPAAPPPPAQEKETKDGLQPASQKDAGKEAYGPPEPPSQEELHKKYDVTQQDVTKLEKSVPQYERYSMAAAADRLRADERPLDNGAQARALKSEAFAENFYNKNVRPIEDKMVDPNQHKVKGLRDYEPGVDPEAANKLAMRAHLDHHVGAQAGRDGVQPGADAGGPEGRKSWEEVPALRSEMYRAEAHETAREAVANNHANNGHAQAQSHAAPAR
jgi:hypothetical protein